MVPSISHIQYDSKHISIIVIRKKMLFFLNNDSDIVQRI